MKESAPSEISEQPESASRVIFGSFEMAEDRKDSVIDEHGDSTSVVSCGNQSRTRPSAESCNGPTSASTSSFTDFLHQRRMLRMGVLSVRVQEVTEITSRFCRREMGSKAMAGTAQRERASARSAGHDATTWRTKEPRRLRQPESVRSVRLVERFNARWLMLSSVSPQVSTRWSVASWESRWESASALGGPSAVGAGQSRRRVRSEAGAAPWIVFATAVSGFTIVRVSRRVLLASIVSRNGISCAGVASSKTRERETRWSAPSRRRCSAWQLEMGRVMANLTQSIFVALKHSRQCLHTWGMLRARSPLYAAIRGKMFTRIDWSSRSSSVDVAGCVERTNDDRALSAVRFARCIAFFLRRHARSSTWIWVSRSSWNRFNPSTSLDGLVLHCW
mmetsp:Transcript_3646/g.8669  ORF Transcript_3646/g.8669 Transcript_3646/m.8669 type:complete len:391 (-) Transcript_3646:364-1536(-)